MLLLTLLAAAAGVGETDGKIMAQDDWQSMSILEVGGTAAGSPHYVRVAAGDLDGDGRADEAYVRLVCVDGTVRQASYMVVNPRDAATGLPTGKRQHNPMTIVKEWRAATPELRAMKVGYHVKKVEGAGARPDQAVTMTAIALAESRGLCPAVSAAANDIVRTKSNITNN